MSRAEYGELVRRIAREEDVDPSLVEAMVQQESNWDPAATSHKGAAGLLQLMPATAADLGVEDPYDPEQNVRGGARYIKKQLDKFGDVPTALAAYNAGPGAVARYGGIPPYGETQKYVDRITNRWLPQFEGEREVPAEAPAEVPIPVVPLPEESLPEDPPVLDLEVPPTFEIEAEVPMQVEPVAAPAGVAPQQPTTEYVSPVKGRESELYWVNLPDGTWTQAPIGMSHKDARALAREKYPEAFKFYKAVEDAGGDSSMFDAFWATASRARHGLFPGLKMLYADATGDEEMFTSAAQELLDATEAAGKIAPDLVSIDEIKETYEKDGVVSAVSKVFEFGAEQVGSSLGFQAPSLAAGLGGWAMGGLLAGLRAGAPVAKFNPIVGATVGAIAGLGTMWATFLSDDLERAYEEGAQDTEEMGMMKAAAAAGGQTALNALGYILLGGYAGVKGLAVGAGASESRRMAAGSFAKAMERLNKRGAITKIAAVVAEEEVAEVGQQALERFAAGLPVSPTDEEAMDEYIHIMLATLAPSVMFGGMGAGAIKWNKHKQKKLSEGIDKKRKELEEVRDGMLREHQKEDAEAIENLSARVSEEEKKVQERLAVARGVTVKDIHNMAESRNIRWDDDAGFLAFTSRIVPGMYTLDSIARPLLDPDVSKKNKKKATKDLAKIYTALQRMPEQELPVSLSVVDNAGLAEFASGLKLATKAGSSESVVRERVKKKLRLGVDMSDAASGALADAYIDRLLDRGFIERKKDGRFVAPKAGKLRIKRDEYNALMSVARESGRLDDEVFSRSGIESEAAREEIRAAAIGRGEIEADGTIILGATRDDDVKVYGIEVEGRRLPGTFANQDEANAAREELYRQRGAGAGAVGVVESTAPAGAVAGFEFDVSEKKAPVWVVRDRDGKAVKVLPSKAKANTWISNRNRQSKRWDVVVDGVVASSHGSSKEANAARRTARKEGAAAAIVRPTQVDSGFTAKRQNGYVLHESKIREQDGSVAERVPVGVFRSKESAERGLERRKRSRFGPESFGGRRATKPRAVARARRLRDDPKYRAAEARRIAEGRVRRELAPEAERAGNAAREAAERQFGPAGFDDLTADQRATIDAIEEALTKLLTSRIGRRVVVRLVASLEGGKGAARFVSGTSLIELAMDMHPDILSKNLEEQRSALLPHLTHESVHALRQMGAITESEWNQLTRWVKKTAIDAATLESLNRGATEGNGWSAGTTWEQFAKRLYSKIGEKGNWIEDEYLEEAVAFAWQHDQLARIEGRAPKGKDAPPAGIVERVMDLLRRIRMALSGRGWSTTEEIFEQMYGDTFARRVEAGKILDDWWSRRTHTPEYAEILAKGLIIDETGIFGAAVKLPGVEEKEKPEEAPAAEPVGLGEPVAAAAPAAAPAAGVPVQAEPARAAGPVDVLSSLERDASRFGSLLEQETGGPEVRERIDALGGRRVAAHDDVIREVTESLGERAGGMADGYVNASNILAIARENATPASRAALDATTVSASEADAAAQTQRGEPESVMNRITSPARQREGEELPMLGNAGLGEYLEHVGDISHRVQQDKPDTIDRVGEKLRMVERLLDKKTWPSDPAEQLDVELRHLAKSNVMRRHSVSREDEAERLYWDEIESEVPKIRERIKRPLAEYKQAHLEHNQPVTEMGQLGKDMAVALADLDFGRLEESARDLRSILDEMEAAPTEAQRQAVRLRSIAPTPASRAALEPGDLIAVGTTMTLEVERVMVAARPGAPASKVTTKYATITEVFDPPAPSGVSYLAKVTTGKSKNIKAARIYTTADGSPSVIHTGDNYKGEVLAYSITNSDRVDPERKFTGGAGEGRVALASRAALEPGDVEIAPGSSSPLPEMVRAYHGGSRARGAEWDPRGDWAGTGEGYFGGGPLGIGTYFNTDKYVGGKFLKHGGLDPVLSEVTIDTSNMINIFDDTETGEGRLRDAARRYLSEDRAKRLRIFDLFRKDRGGVDRDLAYRILDDAGITGAYEPLRRGVEIVVYDPSVIVDTAAPAPASRAALVVGAPGSVETNRDLGRLRSAVQRLRRKGGEEGRFWYQRSGKALYDYVGHDKELFDKLANIFAIYSFNTGVDANVTNALKAWYQWRTGQDVNSSKMKAPNGKSLDELAEEVLYEGKRSFTGRKTRNFYNSMVAAVDPSLAEEGFRGIPVDMWMMRAFGYKNDSPTKRQYDFIESEVARIAERLGWEPYEVQAAIWVATKAGAEKISVEEAAATDWESLFRSRLGQVSWEAIPGESSGHLVGLDGAGGRKRWNVLARYTKNIVDAFLDSDGNDILAKEMGILTPGFFPGIGAWKSKVIPGVQTEFYGAKPHKPARREEKIRVSEETRKLLNAYAAIRGLLMHQDAVAWTRPVWKGQDANQVDKNMVVIDIGNQGSASQAAELYGLMEESTGSDFFAPVATRSGWWIKNVPEVTGMGNNEFRELVKEAVESMNFEREPVIVALAANGGFIENDWKGAGSNGETYMEQVAALPPGVRRRVDSLVAEIQSRIDAVDSEFADEFKLKLREEVAGRLGRRREGFPQTEESRSAVDRLGRVGLYGPLDGGGAGLRLGGQRGRPGGVTLQELRSNATVRGGPDPGIASSVASALGLEVRPGEDTSGEVKVYPLWDLATTVEDADAALRPWLDRIGWDYRIFGPDENGRGFLNPDFDREGYQDKIAWIFQPTDPTGSFRDHPYTLLWRVTHEVAHGQVNPAISAKYGGVGRRAGSLGVLTRGPYVAPSRPLSLADALRAVEWEHETFKRQREILEEDLGIEITDEEFAKENSVNMSDAVYRVLTGQFGDPSDYGVVPTAIDPEVLLDRSKDLLRAAAVDMELDTSETLPQEEASRALRGSPDPSRYALDPGETIDWTPVLIPGKVGRPTLENTTWGTLRFDREGKRWKSGQPFRVLVPAGSPNSLGKLHMDRHNKDISDNTIYTGWEELLPAFLTVALNYKAVDDGEVVVTRPKSDELAILWNPEGFRHPVTLIFEYKGNPESKGGGDSRRDFFVPKTIYADNRYSSPRGPAQVGEHQLRGDDVSARTVQVAELSKSRKKTASEFRRRQEGHRFNKKNASRYSLNGMPTDTKTTPAARYAIDVMHGGNNVVPRTGKNFWQSLMSGFESIDEQWVRRMRKAFLDKFNDLYHTGRLVAKKMGNPSRLMADVAAHSAALSVDKANAFLAAMLRYGGIEFVHTKPLQAFGDAALALPGFTMIKGMVLDHALKVRRNADGKLEGGAITGIDGNGEFTRRDVDLPGTYSDIEGVREVRNEQTGVLERLGGLIPALMPLINPQNKLFDAFISYSRAIRVWRLIQEGNVGVDRTYYTDEHIKNALREAEIHPEIAIAHHNLQKWNDSIVDYLETTGVLTKQMADIWRGSSDYIPFYLEVLSEGKDAMKGLFTDQLSNAVDQKYMDRLITGIPSRKIAGAASEENLMEPIEAIVKNASMLIREGLKNVAVNRAINESLELGLAKRIDAKDKDSGNPYKVTARVNGEVRYYEISDPMLHDTIVGTWDGTHPALERLINRVGIPSRWLREAVTRTPDFAVANMLRDSLSVWAQGGGSKVPVAPALGRFGRQLTNMVRGTTTDEYRLLEMGGAIGGYELAGVDPRKLKRVFMGKVGANVSPLKAMWKVWDTMGEVSARSEAAQRELVYESTLIEVKKRLVEDGMDAKDAETRAQSEAIFQAMEVLNFSRKGNSWAAKFFSSAIPFLNARFQGMDRLYRVGVRGEGPNGEVDRKTAIMTLVTRGGMLWGATMLYAFANYDDEEFERKYAKYGDDNWLLKIPGTSEFLAVPIPFEVGVIFKAAPELLTRTMLGAEGRDTVQSLKHHLMSTLALNPTPQMVKPLYEAYGNFNFYTGQPIVPYYMRGMPGYESKPTTTTPARVLGEAVGISPLKIENTIRGYFGTMGMWGLSSVDWMANSVGWGLTSKPLPKATDLPLIRRFVKGELDSGLTSQYYDFSREVGRVMDTVRDLRRQGRREEAKEIVSAHEGLLRMGRVKKVMDRRLAGLRKKDMAIRLSNLSGAEKSRRIDEIDRKRIRLLRNVPEWRKRADMPLGILK